MNGGAATLPALFSLRSCTESKGTVEEGSRSTWEHVKLAAAAGDMMNLIVWWISNTGPGLLGISDGRRCVIDLRLDMPSLAPSRADSRDRARSDQ